MGVDWVKIAKITTINDFINAGADISKSDGEKQQGAAKIANNEEKFLKIEYKNGAVDVHAQNLMVSEIAIVMGEALNLLIKDSVPQEKQAGIMCNALAVMMNTIAVDNEDGADSQDEM